MIKQISSDNISSRQYLRNGKTLCIQLIKDLSPYKVAIGCEQLLHKTHSLPLIAIIILWTPDCDFVWNNHDDFGAYARLMDIGANITRIKDTWKKSNTSISWFLHAILFNFFLLWLNNITFQRIIFSNFLLNHVIEWYLENLEKKNERFSNTIPTLCNYQNSIKKLHCIWLPWNHTFKVEMWCTSVVQSLKYKGLFEEIPLFRPYFLF